MKRLGLLAAVLCALLAAAAPAGAQTGTDDAQVERGRELFLNGCTACHGPDARGVEGQGPSLVGAGAASADFYVRTGRMPLPNTGDQPERSEPAYPEEDIRALVAYIGSLGGPPVPDVDIARGDLAEGQRAFTNYCAGCHTVTTKGGYVPGGVAPSLDEATATQVAEAVRVGPWLMPAWDERQIDRRELDSIARYVVEVGQDPESPGGWGIGFLGPVPEGMVVWLIAGGALLVIARLVGARAER